jgi:DNA-directed RNA polymerase specialized sigma24 family protein
MGQNNEYLKKLSPFCLCLAHFPAASRLSTKPMHSLTVQLYPALLRQAAILLSGSAAAHAMQPADLLHMAVEKLCRRPPAHIEEQPALFTGLLRTIMQRTLADELRKSRAARRPDLTAACPLEDAWHVSDPAAETTSGNYVRESLDGLEQQNAAAARLLRLHYFEGRSGVELANGTGLSTACISRRLSAALCELRAVIEREDMAAAA